jgi:hypothetical protein
MSDEGIKRYEVTVERKLIVYAANPEDAGTKALAYEGFKGDLSKAPTRVVATKEIPAPIDEAREPIIDTKPDRAAQK